MSTAAAPAPWTMPAYLEPYRRLVIVDGGGTVEAAMNSGPKHTDFNAAVRQVAVAHQVALLKQLMGAGLLLVEQQVAPPPTRIVGKPKGKRVVKARRGAKR